MLGWFKKKFGKKTEEPVGEEPALIEVAVEERAEVSSVVEPSQELAAGQPPAEQAVAAPTETSTPAEPEEAMPEAAPPAAVEELGEFLEQEEDLLAEQPTAAEPEPPLMAESEAEEPELSAAPMQAATVAEPLGAGQEVDSEEDVDQSDSGVSAVAAPSLFPTQEKPERKSMFRRLQERLGKTKDSFVYRLDHLFLGRKEIDQDLFDRLEEILITADLGVGTTRELLDTARKKVKRDQLSDPQALKGIIRDQILAYIVATDQAAELVMPAEGPFVIMVVGVNGVGKTTTIGKMAAKFVRAGQSVLLVAGDTFRAAAINQLKIWGERVGVKVIAQNPGADPSSVVFDGLEYGVAHNYDVILIDTAGRLHTSVNLMEELKKIRRVIAKKLPGAPHEVMLVLDANTGQNGISQAKLFHEAVGVSGLALTKLDGTAKGGIVANVCRESKIPVRFIGIGEQLDDLRDFDAREFVDALFSQQAES